MVVTLRALGSTVFEADDAPPDALWSANPNDWLTLEQAACELGCTAATVRRRIGRGELRSRIVPRKGGLAYRVYIPGSRHGSALFAAHPAPMPSGSARQPLAPVDMAAYRRARAARIASRPAVGGAALRRLEEIVMRVAGELGRVLGSQRMPSAEAAEQGRGSCEGPYAHYRRLVREQRRWWQPWRG